VYLYFFLREPVALLLFFAEADWDFERLRLRLLSYPPRFLLADRLDTVAFLLIILLDI